MELCEDVIGADDYRTFPRRLEGKVRSRHHAEYAGWHHGLCWNGRRFDRFPEYIVRAHCIDDVVQTIRFARRHRLPVSVRGSGHSYCGCFLRDSGILLDVSALKEVTVDPAARRATIQPGATSQSLYLALAEHGLAFPTGHGAAVGLSGFLLGGGLGINFRAWGGMSAFAVHAIDVVTADGQLVHSNADQNPELLWAARGAGPALFFVVVKFYIDCWPMPRCITSQTHRVAFSRLAELATSIERAAPSASLQVTVAIVEDAAAAAEDHGKQAILSTVAFADTPEDALDLHRSLMTALPQGLVQFLDEDEAFGFEAIYRQTEAMMVSRRYRVDNILTDSVAEAVEILAAHVPRQPSIATTSLLIWRGEPAQPEAAFSAHGRFFLSTYAQWNDEANDESNGRWLKSLYDELAGVSTSCYVNEFDLETRWRDLQRCFSAENYRRLGEMRARYDADGLFRLFNDAAASMLLG